jgi:hypothetical protein
MNTLESQRREALEDFWSDIGTKTGEQIESGGNWEGPAPDRDTYTCVAFVQSPNHGEPTIKKIVVVIFDTGSASIRSATWDGMAFFIEGTTTVEEATTQKIQIIIDSRLGLDEPVLATFSKSKAKAKYFEIIKEDGRKVTEETKELTLLFENARTDEDGVERAELGDTSYVKIAGHWYDLRDSYGSPSARWFELEVEE